MMRSFCTILGLANLLAFHACIFWLLGDRSGTGAPVISAILALNMGVGWLFLAGLQRDEAGRRTWTARPAFGAIAISAVLAGAAVMKSF